VETPDEIVRQFPKKLYRTAIQNDIRLLEELRTNPAVESALMFGEYLHVTFKDDLPLADDSRWKGNFEPIEPSIEDCFIYLMDKA
jgi:hypothetical protein